jgi:hypothetical protein
MLAGGQSCLIIPALLIFAAFAIAGIFASHIATPAYNANIVLVRNRFDQGHGGITLFVNSLEAVPDFDVKAANDTRAAVAYARSYYSPASGIIDSVACSLFTKAKLEYAADEVGCPFGDPNEPFENSMCAFNSNKGAYRLQTVLLDSHDDFGINARPRNRVKLIKELVSSPLVIAGFNSTGPADYQVSVIGCTEQYSICNPNLKSNSCTPQSGQYALPTLIQSHNFNSAQLVTAYRMIYMIADGTTYSSVNGLGPDALQIWSKVYDFVALGALENQWQIEVEGWLETTLAKWQAYMVGYASNTADLG